MSKSVKDISSSGDGSVAAGGSSLAVGTSDGIAAVLSIGEQGAGAMVTAMESAIVGLPFARLSAGLEGLRGSENVVLLLRSVTMSAIRATVREAHKSPDVKVADVWAGYGYADLKEYLGKMLYTPAQFHGDCRLYESGPIWAAWVAGGMTRGTAVIAISSVTNELKRRGLKRSTKDVGPLVAELNAQAADLYDGKVVSVARELRKGWRDHGLGCDAPAEGETVELPLRAQYAEMKVELAECEQSMIAFQKSLDTARALKGKLTLNLVELRAAIDKEDRAFPATSEARNLAGVLGVDIRHVVGTGKRPKGQRLVSDVQAAAMVSNLEDVTVTVATAPEG